MKIALICTEKLPVPPIAGGAVQLYIEGILPEISKLHDVTVFSVDHPNLPVHEEVNGVNYIRVVGNDRNEYIANVKKNITEKYDLIHIFNRPRFALKLGRDFPNSKISLSLHNEMFELEKIPMKMAVECIKRVEFITTVSRFIADGVSNLYPIAADKLHPVYSGVDTDKYKSAFSTEGQKNKEELKKKYNVEDKKVVLFVGRLSVKKGVDKLLRAMKKVMDLRSDVALVVIGSKWYGANSEDEYTKALDSLSKSLNGPIVFTGFLPPSEIPTLYNIGDIFVCPSQWNEPLARVHYEAMAAGIPIITTNRGGNSEVVKGFGNGIVIDDFTNSEAFADKIMELLENSEAANEMGQTGRMLAESKYDWKRVADDLLKLFNDVEKTIEEELISKTVEKSSCEPSEEDLEAVKEEECGEKEEEKAEKIAEEEEALKEAKRKAAIQLIKEVTKEETKEVTKETDTRAIDSVYEIHIKNGHRESDKKHMIQSGEMEKTPVEKQVNMYPKIATLEEYYLKLYEQYLD